MFLKKIGCFLTFIGFAVGDHFVPLQILNNTFKEDYGELKIVGGKDANIEDFPHQVALLLVEELYCGGSIVSLKHILTAAHCLRDGDQIPLNIKDIYVRAGSSLSNEGGSYINVDQAIEHPNYNSDTNDYDVAVLILKSPLSESSKIKPIALNSDPDIPEDSVAIATGWGRLSQNGPFPTQLQQVKLPTVSRSNCRVVYGNDRITDRMLCAGYPEGKKDTCQGDSGSPLVFNKVQIGITSWGDGCGDPNSPGIYTDVSAVKSWIENTIQANP